LHRGDLRGGRGGGFFVRGGALRFARGDFVGRFFRFLFLRVLKHSRRRKLFRRELV
jgi:hypothetical protein